MTRQRHIPKYGHHKATGRARVTLNGREIYLGKWGTPESRQRYERVIAEWLANGRTLSAAPTTCVSVAELALAYWTHAQAYCRKPDGTPTSQVDIVQQTLRPLRELYGSDPVTTVGPMALQAIRQRLTLPPETSPCRM